MGGASRLSLTSLGLPKRLAQRPSVDLGVDAVTLLDDVRRSRDAETADG